MISCFMVACLFLALQCAAGTMSSTFLARRADDARITSTRRVTWRRHGAKIPLKNGEKLGDWSLNRWHYFADCYDGQNPADPWILRMGVLVDRGFFVKAGNTTRSVLVFLDAVVQVANTIFMKQLSLKLRVEKVIMVRSIYERNETRVPGINNDTFSWLKFARTDPYPYNCQGKNTILGIYTESFKQWVNKYFKNTYGIWHLLTDCVLTPDTRIMGRAFQQTLCSPDNVGVSRFANNYDKFTTSTVGLVFAHEVAHNLGAAHTFSPHEHDFPENSHLGLMDYDADHWNAYTGPLFYPDLRHFQLHPMHKPNICDALSFFRTMFRTPWRAWGKNPRAFTHSRECFALEGCPLVCNHRRQCAGECNRDACGEERRDCVPLCARGCLPAWRGDGKCDKECFNAECNWDGWDAKTEKGGDCDCNDGHQQLDGILEKVHRLCGRDTPLTCGAHTKTILNERERTPRRSVPSTF